MYRLKYLYIELKYLFCCIVVNIFLIHGVKRSLVKSMYCIQRNPLNRYLIRFDQNRPVAHHQVFILSSIDTKCFRRSIKNYGMPITSCNIHERVQSVIQITFQTGEMPRQVF